ncbi:MAG: hypothetical protein ACM34H_05420, partial [Deltaproteobacteria bacterium]
MNPYGSYSPRLAAEGTYIDNACLKESRIQELYPPSVWRAGVRIQKEKEESKLVCPILASDFWLL